VDTRTRSERGAHNQTKEKLQGEVADLRQEATATRERAAHLEGQVTALKEHFEVLTVANAKPTRAPAKAPGGRQLKASAPKSEGTDESRKGDKRASTYAERCLQTVDLRRSGQTYQQIGEQLGVSRQTAYRLVARALAGLTDKTKEVTEALIRLELERYDAMLYAIWPQVEAGKESAIPAALRISDARRKLLGLDAPAKTALTDPSGQEPGSNVVIYLTDNGRDPEITRAAIPERELPR